MVAAAGRYSRVISRLISLALVVAILASLWLSLAAPPNFGLSLRRLPHEQAIIIWVAPNGPAWSAGMQPSSRVVIVRQTSPGSLTMTGSEGLIHVTVAAPTPLQLLLVGLGLLLIALGAIVAARSVDRQAGLSFWFLTLCGGAALGFVPAGFHGVPWALAAEFVSLRLFGPALLAFTYHFPGQPTERPRSSPGRWLCWLPALAILLLYPLA